MRLDRASEHREETTAHILISLHLIGREAEVLSVGACIIIIASPIATIAHHAGLRPIGEIGGQSVNGLGCVITVEHLCDDARSVDCAGENARPNLVDKRRVAIGDNGCALLT